MFTAILRRHPYSNLSTNHTIKTATHFSRTAQLTDKNTLLPQKTHVTGANLLGTERN